MNKLQCYLEKSGDLVLGLSLLAIGLLFTVFSLTIIPAIGLLVAIPALALSIPFLRASYKETCQLRSQQ